MKYHGFLSDDLNMSMGVLFALHLFDLHLTLVKVHPPGRVQLPGMVAMSTPGLTRMP